MIGQWIAANAPDRVDALVLANTSPHFPDPSLMEARRRTAMESGMGAIEETAMGRLFVPAQLASNAALNIRRVLRATNPMGYAGCCAAIRDMDLRASLGSIRARTLIVAGHRDVSTPFEGHGAALTLSIAGSKVARFDTAHLSNLGAPRAFNRAVLEFLLPQPEDAFKEGLAKRRAILGEAHVHRSLMGTTEFTRAFQELLTRYAWGSVWSRPGLDERTRRLLTLALTAALGRWEEFRLHLRAGLDGGMEQCDIEEALLHVAIYAGVPAANTGFKIAGEEIN
jgi:3-oxoadipate enol-lactonase / 4-carboxymuconolactone decarboxylase